MNNEVDKAIRKIKAKYPLATSVTMPEINRVEIRTKLPLMPPEGLGIGQFVGGIDYDVLAVADTWEDAWIKAASKVE
jgi:hypothetical protein